MNETTSINQFRQAVYQSLDQRADAGLDLIDALTSAVTVESPVAMSESSLFRCDFSSVYDFLKYGRQNLWQLRRILYDHQPEEAETVAGV